MLTIKAEASAGADLREETMPEMVRLARATGCRVELEGNETKFWTMPDDTVLGLQHAFDRLYLHSRLVASWISLPVPRSVARG